MEELQETRFQTSSHEHAWYVIVMLLHVWHVSESSCEAWNYLAQLRCVSTAHQKCSNMSHIWCIDNETTMWCLLMETLLRAAARTIIVMHNLSQDLIKPQIQDEAVDAQPQATPGQCLLSG